MLETDDSQRVDVSGHLREMDCDEMPLKTTRKKNYSSSEDIEMVRNYQLWMLKAEIGEAVAGSPNSNELTHQEDLFQR
ncbi:hypothetical protein X798_00198 [Onchocerca flexuosa]|uniref:Uncharacterized protein n=1 Tax=Onchocerca flexuosa TaxID=387005 RepID=A0A238C517_9BILA|nr:hypothetical protein X798_00198 [Onchocerca flexuosa]